ncbi:MAG: peptidoglycan-binding protein [Verrucomicrobiales bacterium]|nr:peptidoglycan-binding protein [Verrucomicrobiales bacterium]
MFIRPDADAIQLRIQDGDGWEEWPIRLGHLDPLDTPSGVQQRLRNLHYQCDSTGVWDDATREALREFQEAQGIEVNGDADSATQSKLREIHGS